MNKFKCKEIAYVRLVIWTVMQLIADKSDKIVYEPGLSGLDHLNTRCIFQGQNWDYTSKEEECSHLFQVF